MLNHEHKTSMKYCVCDLKYACVSLVNFFPIQYADLNWCRHTDGDTNCISWSHEGHDLITKRVEVIYMTFFSSYSCKHLSFLLYVLNLLCLYCTCAVCVCVCAVYVCLWTMVRLACCKVCHLLCFWSIMINFHDIRLLRAILFNDSIVLTQLHDFTYAHE